MGIDILLYAGISLFGLSTMWIVYTLFSVNQDAKALSWATQDAPEKSDSPIINISRPLVHQLTMKYAKRMKSPKLRKSIERKLETAGLTKELNVDEFLGLKILWGIVFPILIFILNFALALGYPPAMPLLFIAFGWNIPDFHANKHRQVRQNSIIIDLPFFVDLLALASQAGAEFTASIEKITEKAEDSVLAVEFEEFLKEVRLGVPREEALKAMSRRLDIPEVTSFVNVLNDATSTGASIAPALKDQSEFMRVERFVRAEKAGAKAAQAILLPIIMFIVPAVFLIMGAPMYLQFTSGGG